MPELHFDSWTAFWAMGGYAFFVWLSFGATLLALFGLYWLSRRQQQQFRQQLQNKLAREERVRQHMAQEQ